MVLYKVPVGYSTWLPGPIIWDEVPTMVEIAIF
jgi:hypothetical protein